MLQLDVAKNSFARSTVVDDDLIRLGVYSRYRYNKKSAALAQRAASCKKCLTKEKLADITGST